jgi:hypothetical protein
VNPDISGGGGDNKVTVHIQDYHTMGSVDMHTENTTSSGVQGGVTEERIFTSRKRVLPYHTMVKTEIFTNNNNTNNNGDKKIKLNDNIKSSNNGSKRLIPHVSAYSKVSQAVKEEQRIYAVPTVVWSVLDKN